MLLWYYLRIPDWVWVISCKAQTKLTKFSSISQLSDMWLHSMGLENLKASAHTAFWTRARTHSLFLSLFHSLFYENYKHWFFSSFKQTIFFSLLLFLLAQMFCFSFSLFSHSQNLRTHTLSHFLFKNAPTHSFSPSLSLTLENHHATSEFYSKSYLFIPGTFNFPHLGWQLVLLLPGGGGNSESHI